MSGFECNDCGVHTLDIGEYYMVRGDVWPAGAHMLCIACLESRIGRSLTPQDFTMVHRTRASNRILARVGAP